jgi:hypothetical protein
MTIPLTWNDPLFSGLTNSSPVEIKKSDIVTIKGVADANSQVKLYDGNTSLGTIATAADGTWSFQTSAAVSDTVHTYTAKQIDSVGQVVGTSGSAILGSTGSNTLKSTSGDDILVGGGQADTFVFAANFAVTSLRISRPVEARRTRSSSARRCSTALRTFSRTRAKSVRISSFPPEAIRSR